MTSTQIRRRLLAVGMALLLVTAGCATSTNSISNPSTTAREVTTPETTQTTTTAEKTTTSRQTSLRATATSHESNTIVRGDVTYHNASEEKLRQVNETMAHFFEKLPANKSERMETVATAANTSCGFYPINASLFNAASSAHERGQQLYRVAQVMNEHFNSRIQPSQIRSAAQDARKVGQYATVIGTYNNYVKASCPFDRDKPETVEDYYLATAALGFELLMFQYSMYYKTAFTVTRKVSHTHTYRVFQVTYGDKALGMVMSGTYWLTHGTLQAAPKFVRDELDQMNINTTANVSGGNYSSQVEQFAGAEVVPRGLSADVARCVEQATNETEASGGVFGSISDTASDVVDSVQDELRGGFTTAEVLKTVKGADARNLTEEQIQKVQKCMDES